MVSVAGGGGVGICGVGICAGVEAFGVGAFGAGVDGFWDEVGAFLALGAGGAGA